MDPQSDWNQIHSWSVKLMLLLFVDNPTEKPQNKPVFFYFYTFPPFLGLTIHKHGKPTFNGSMS